MSEAPPPSLTGVLPVICDRCRAEGLAGDSAFAGIPDILAFDPVPRRTHVNNWTAEHQRAFIAALALTGSARQAARTIGRVAFGAEQLRKARGGRSFADAWDAALEVAREREFARIHANLSALVEEVDGDPPLEPHPHAAWPTDDQDEDAQVRDLEQARQRIRKRLLRARRLFLSEICIDPAKRAAWETLCGPVDWERAKRFEAQADEPYHPCAMRKPDMFLPVEHGWLHEITGTGEDKTAELRQSRLTYEREHGLPITVVEDGDGNGEDDEGQSDEGQPE